MQKETLELKVSLRTVRMLRALAALKGSTPSQIEQLATSLFEEAISYAIKCELDLVPEVENIRYHRREMKKPEPQPQPQPVFDQGLSAGLGDEYAYEEEEPQPETDAFAMVPKQGGLSDEALERDLEVDDPEHEAKAEPPTDEIPYSDAEEMFRKIAGIPLPVEEAEEIDHRILKRKKRLDSKAKVTELLGDSQITAGSDGI